MMKALEGIRVLDLTQVLSGPFCTQMLADHGADVIKIEPPEGDGSRIIGLQAGAVPEDGGAYFQSVNRNKRSIVIDLKQEEGKQIIRSMVRKADVLVENFRAGVMERLGLGYEVLREINPKLVYATVRGFGDPRTGESPLVDWPAFDIIAQATGGILSITGTSPEESIKIGPGVGDIVPGIFLAFGVLAALRHAQATGNGQFVDVAMSDGILAITERIVHQYLSTGHIPHPEGNAHPLFCPYGLFRAKDGWIAIGCLKDSFWESLCRIMGRQDMLEDRSLKTSSQRQRRRDFINDQVSDWTRSRTKAELTQLLGGVVPFGPVNNAVDILKDPHFAARKMLVHMKNGASGITLVNTPIKMTESPGGVETPPPKLGEHTRAILEEFGFRSDEIDRYCSNSAVR